MMCLFQLIMVFPETMVPHRSKDGYGKEEHASREDFDRFVIKVLVKVNEIEEELEDASRQVSDRFFVKV